METDIPNSASDAFLRIVSLLYRTSHQLGLSRAQWMALRYFSRANKYSRTVSGFAEFHAVTVGAASQAVKALAAKGLVSTRIRKSDRRVAHITVTAKGYDLLNHDPMMPLVDAIKTLDHPTQQGLVSNLFGLIERLDTEDAATAFGTCSTCVFSKSVSDGNADASSHYCLFKRERIEEDIHKICVSYETGLMPFQNTGEVAR